MKEIVVLSGKGGTGKTSIIASLAVLGGKDLVLADCDVDAADMHLLMDPKPILEEDFYSGKIAEIKEEGCTRCQECIDVCHFNAIHFDGNKLIVNDLECEGCGYCYQICPTNTIVMKPRYAGKFYVSKTRIKNTLVHARLGIAADNSGKLVTKVRTEAKKIAQEQNKKYILVDGSPGIGCPVVASLTGANYVIMVTEPTLSGIHDLKRLFDLVRKFKIPLACIINKADLNTVITNKIKGFLLENEIELLAEIPYNSLFTKAITQGKTLVEIDTGKSKQIIVNVWDRITDIK